MTNFFVKSKIEKQRIIQNFVVKLKDQKCKFKKLTKINVIKY